MDKNLVRPHEVLTASEINLIRRALLEWSGPARCSDDFAAAMGYADFSGLVESSSRFRQKLEDDDPIAGSDWVRMLLATEVVFVSDVVGSGVEWSTTTGLTDEYTISTLRTIQRKLVRITRYL